MQSSNTARVRAIRWVFTINNFTQEDEEAVMNLPDQPWCKCTVAEEEHLDEGTPHIQGYLETHTPKDRTALSRYFNSHAWIEVARGSTYDNWNYCTKEGNIIVEHNKPTNADNRPHRAYTQNQEVAHSFLEDSKTQTRQYMIDNYPGLYARYHQLYDQIHSSYAIQSITAYPGRLHDKNLWIYGPAGSGKTTLALSDLPYYQIYFKLPNKWWDGFDPSIHKRILIDEFPDRNIADVLANFVKRWGDRFPYNAEIKNGATVINPNIPVIVTSNYSIDETFSRQQDRDAIHRRYQEIYLDGSRSHLPYYCHLDLLYSHLRQGNEIDSDL